MTSRPVWMVRAGEHAYRIEDFKEKSVVAIGWGELGPLNKLKGREGIAQRMRSEWPDWHKMKIALCAGQLYRFAFELRQGDRILTYDPSRRVYLVGKVAGDYEYQEGLVEDLANVRRVKWEGEVSRDWLTVPTKNVLGAISTIFTLTEDAAADIERALTSRRAQQEAPEEDEPAEEEDLLGDVQARAVEFIKDRVIKLDWEEMQDLVAGLLRAMGYKARVSPSGPDRGKDIVASRDGLGFESPRIVVEVKHRPSQSMGAPEIRSFLGGRHSGDRGLYVSTGGFTKEAQIEADRASIPLTLLDIDDFVKALLEHYEQMDIDAQRLLPLKKIYWPV